jgi:CRP-like cAMP-binding protein
MGEKNGSQGPSIPAILARVTLFGGLAPADLDGLAARVRFIRKAADEVVLAEGDDPCRCYVVVKGKLQYCLLNPDGKRFVVGNFKAGDCCGLADGLGGWRYLGRLEVVQDATLLSLPLAAIRVISRADIDFCRRLLTHSLAYSHRLQETIKDLTFSALERLSRHLFRQAFDAGSLRSEGGLSFALNARKSGLAEELGITPETLSRMLAQLQRQGYISVDGQQITVHNLRGLVYLSEGLKSEEAAW